MTYSEWLTSVDQAFEAAGRRLRVSGVSPAELLEAFGKGTEPGEFVKRIPFALDALITHHQPKAVPAGGGSILNSLSNPMALEAIDRPKAAFVVRCLNALGWISLVLSGLVMLAWVLFSLFALFGTNEAVTTVNGFETAVNGFEKKAQAQTAAALVGFSSIGGLLSGVTIFLTGILCWWAEAMLKGLYRLVGKD